jgi:ABC-type multidrug transport system ATPase subunit
MSIGKTYKINPALADVNMEVTKGEIITILGPNGAGKSTLINILTGQLSSSTGYAKVGPFIIHNDLFIDANYVKRLIGVCSQFDYLWDELTVYETLHMYARLRGISATKVNEYIEEKLLSVNLDKKKNERVSSLSGGMKRRLSICISTLGEPFIIFMDEPTTGLDPNNRRKIWKLINVNKILTQNLKKDRVIFMSTHLLEEAEYLSDRLAIITSGKLRFIGTCSELRATYHDTILLTISNFLLNLAIDVSKVADRLYILEDNIKFTFVYSKIKYYNSGIYCIEISNNQKKEVLKAFELFNKKSDDKRITDILFYVKDVNISQSKLENIYLDVNIYLNFRYVRCILSDNTINIF